MKHLAFPLILAASMQLQAARPQLLLSTVDQDVTRVQMQLRQIRAQQTSRESRNQQMRALIDREIALTQAKIDQQGIYEKQAAYSRASVNAPDQLQRRLTANERATTQADASAKTDATDTAARDRRKVSLDNLQKLLDTLRSMNPEI